MGEPPLLLGAFQLREMALVETPVTFKFCGLDGTAACGTAAMLTFLEAWPTVLVPPNNCCDADAVTTNEPLDVGVQFIVAVHVATGVNDPLLTGVQVPAIVPRSVPLLIWKSKLTAPLSSSQDVSALLET